MQETYTILKEYDILFHSTVTDKNILENDMLWMSLSYIQSGLHPFDEGCARYNRFKSMNNIFPRIHLLKPLRKIKVLNIYLKGTKHYIDKENNYELLNWFKMKDVNYEMIKDPKKDLKKDLKIDNCLNTTYADCNYKILLLIKELNRINDNDPYLFIDGYRCENDQDEIAVNNPSKKFEITDTYYLYKILSDNLFKGELIYLYKKNDISYDLFLNNYRKEIISDIKKKFLNNEYKEKLDNIFNKKDKLIYKGNLNIDLNFIRLDLLDIIRNVFPSNINLDFALEEEEREKEEEGEEEEEEEGEEENNRINILRGNIINYITKMLDLNNFITDDFANDAFDIIVDNNYVINDYIQHTMNSYYKKSIFYNSLCSKNLVTYKLTKNGMMMTKQQNFSLIYKDSSDHVLYI